jgi:hypothetical protein
VEDGVRVLLVKNLPNPYTGKPDFNHRFVFTLNKLLAWTLVEYERVAVLDADNLILQGTDELFQCGDFCAVFINPCVFHTGLFVLKVSLALSPDLLRACFRVFCGLWLKRSQWYLTSMCFVREWYIEFLLRSVALWLLQIIT